MSTAQPQQTGKAVLWMMGAIASFSIMAISGREAGRIMPTAELLTWRSIVGFAVILVITMATRQGLAQVKSRKLHIHLGRNTAHFLGQYCWYYAVTLIPLAQVFAFEFTSPVWLAIMAPFFLGEVFNRGKAWAIGLGFLGILLVARPGVAVLGEGHMFAFMSSIGFAFTMLWTKQLTRQSAVLPVLFWMTLMQLPMGLLLAGGLPSLPENGTQAMWLILLGLCGLSAHFCYTTAFSLADVTVIVPVDFGRLPVIALIGMVIYAEALDPWVFIGAILVFTGNYLNIRHQAKQSQT